MTNEARAEMSGAGNPRKSEQLRKVLSATACLNVFASSAIPARLSGRREVVLLKLFVEANRPLSLAPHRKQRGVTGEPSHILRAFERAWIGALLLAHQTFDFA